MWILSKATWAVRERYFHPVKEVRKKSSCFKTGLLLLHQMAYLYSVEGANLFLFLLHSCSHWGIINMQLLLVINGSHSWIRIAAYYPAICTPIIMANTPSAGFGTGKNLKNHFLKTGRHIHIHTQEHHPSLNHWVQESKRAKLAEARCQESS